MLETQSVDTVNDTDQLSVAARAEEPTGKGECLVAEAALRDQDGMQLEAACVDLICEFESMLTRSVKERLAGYLGEISAIVEHSVQLACDFGNAHLVGMPLQALNKRADEARECAKALRKAVSSYEWKTVRRIIGRESANENDVLKIHGELGAAVAMVLITTVGPVIEALDAQSRSGVEVLEIVRLFVAELEEKW